LPEAGAEGKVMWRGPDGRAWSPTSSHGGMALSIQSQVEWWTMGQSLVVLGAQWGRECFWCVEAHQKHFLARGRSRGQGDLARPGWPSL